MSDMIDRLSDLANEAGADVSARLASPAVTAGLVSQVGRGVRRRRAIAASLTAAVVVVGAVGAVVVPRLMEPAPIPPAGDVRVPVQTNEGFITYNDGSMQVLNHRGVAVEVPAPVEDAPVFASRSIPDACAVDVTALSPGWTTQFTDAYQVMTFGRPLLLDETGYHVLAQGQRVELGEDYRRIEFAFSADVDPAIAPYVVMTVDSYLLAPDGRVAYVGSQLESRPAIEYTGLEEAGTYTATLTTRGLAAFDECEGVSTTVDPTAPLVRYLTVTAFLNDGHGHVNPIATHTSWITLVKESS